MGFQMKNSPFKKVRKTEKGAALRRWFKEDWRTPSGKKAMKTEKIHLDQLKEFLVKLQRHGAN